jgi:hypothetical protein
LAARGLRASARLGVLGLLWVVVPAAALGASYWQAWMQASPRPAGSPPISRTDARLLAELPATLVPAGARTIVGLRQAAEITLPPGAPPLQLLAAADLEARRDDSARLCGRAAHDFVCAEITIGAHPRVVVSHRETLIAPGAGLGLTPARWSSR